MRPASALSRRHSRISRRFWRRSRGEVLLEERVEAQYGEVLDGERQAAQDYLDGETLHGLARRHDLSRNLIRIWVRKCEDGAFDEDARTANLLQEYEARIAALEVLSGGRRSRSGF